MITAASRTESQRVGAKGLVGETGQPGAQPRPGTQASAAHLEELFLDPRRRFPPFAFVSRVTPSRAASRAIILRSYGAQRSIA